MKLDLFQTPLQEQDGPNEGTANILEALSSQDIAYHMTVYEWQLFTTVHEVILDSKGMFSIAIPALPVPELGLVKLPCFHIHAAEPHIHMYFHPFQYELIYQVFGRNQFRRIMSNLDVFQRRFNQVQFWVVTEMCLANSLSRRVTLLRKFIKIAQQ